MITTYSLLTYISKDIGYWNLYFGRTCSQIKYSGIGGKFKNETYNLKKWHFKTFLIPPGPPIFFFVGQAAKQRAYEFEATWFGGTAFRARNTIRLCHLQPLLWIICEKKRESFSLTVHKSKSERKARKMGWKTCKFTRYVI